MSRPCHQCPTAKPMMCVISTQSSRCRKPGLDTKRSRATVKRTRPSRKSAEKQPYIAKRIAMAAVCFIVRLIGTSDLARYSTLVTIVSSFAATVWRINYIDGRGPSGMSSMTNISLGIFLGSTASGLDRFWQDLTPLFCWYASRIGLALHAYQSWRNHYWLPFAVTIASLVPLFIIGSMAPAKFWETAVTSP